MSDIRERFYERLTVLREEQLDELTGKGKLDSIRLHYKNKADDHGTNAFKIATNRSTSKTQKYSNELEKRNVSKSKENRAANLIRLRNKKKVNEEQLDELKASTARSAEHKAAGRYYNDYDDETAARRKALKDKTPESREGAEKAKSKREKSAKRVIRFQNYADKKEKKLEEGTVQKQKNDFRSPKYKYSMKAKHQGVGKFHAGTYRTGTDSYDDKDYTKVSHGVARKMTKKYRSSDEAGKTKSWNQFWQTGKMDLNELQGKGSLEKIRDVHQRKLNKANKNAGDMTNDYDDTEKDKAMEKMPKTLKYSNEYDKYKVSRAKVDRANTLIRHRNKKK
jgi:hypothetical protein